MILIVKQKYRITFDIENRKIIERVLAYGQKLSFNIVAADEHVPEVDCYIRTIKECMRLR